VERTNSLDPNWTALAGPRCEVERDAWRTHGAGRMTRPAVPIEENLRRYIEKPGPLETPCWIWQRACDRRTGYGLLTWNGKQLLAHRAAWIYHKGPINSDRLMVCHHCDTRLCINPLHLFLGSHADNQRDSVLKGRRYPRGENSSRAVLTEIDGTIWHIKKGRNWRHTKPFQPIDGQPLPVPPTPKPKIDFDKVLAEI
jgi:hypothetical protein